jgi:hypothetical protein
MKMRNSGSLFLLLIVLAVSGCSSPVETYTTKLVPALEWTRIPKSPKYTVEVPIPLRVGIILDVSPAYSTSGLDVIKEWEKMQLFDSLIYHYQEDDPVDAVMRLTTAGKVEEEGMLSKVGVGILSELTFGVSTLLVGESATFTHDALAVINQSSNEIGRYSVEVSSTVSWEADVAFGGPHYFFKPSPGHGRKGSSLAAGYELQGKRLAFELAKKIRADRKNLLSKLGKPQEETTAL